jgi:bifunctional N-acetylglucosamine-1-phosphate-uridyltransferase/glucosamine-1-phosphate-acetyltransferase GlmU-like protein
MRSWTGIALARTAPGGDGMQSRLSTYLHPLAGRPLAWHTVSALAAAHPAAGRLLLIDDGADLNPDLFGEFTRLGVVRSEPETPLALPDLGPGPVLIADAAAPALGPELSMLLAEPEGTYLAAPDGSVAAVLTSAAEAASLLRDGGGVSAMPDAMANARPLEAVPGAVVVRDRVALARATRIIHDRLVERLMTGGATFLLPNSVLVDVDVQIGRDTVIYPGVVLEGQTVIGEETVVGPGCRIIDSWVGSGVELKGWNFISRSSVRNRAILEPYVRRGFD